MLWLEHISPEQLQMGIAVCSLCLLYTSTRGIMMMIVLTIYYGFSSAGIDNWGHIGGLLAGFAATVILYHRNRQKY